MNEERHAGYNAEDALSTFTIADGFKMEMVASEPLISDPVDMEIDEYGRMYVVEMHGYPLDKTGSGKIVILSDENGDGKFDKRVVFKEGLVLPNSIMRWKKGVLVTDSPALLYLEDTNNDGKADIVDTVITGFALTNPQHNANSPVYGIDNWIYVAHEGEVSTKTYKEEFGDIGGPIVFASDTNAVRLPRNASGRSIRLQPDRKNLELLSSRCQFGHHFDTWGRLFECDNSNHVIHEVIAQRYFVRNKDLVISDATQSLSDHLNAAEVFPITTNPDRQILTDVGVMTSACGITNYLGGAFPEPYNRATFTAEPVSNLVHVDLLQDSGATFRASRIVQQKEFLASTDAWSRPVNFYVGPDGALYVLDYYRKVIESPEWMSDEAIKAGGLYDGHDKGRIYRITPDKGLTYSWTKGLKLGNATASELVQQLSNPNYWWRINSQRLLVDRREKAAIPELIKTAKSQDSLGRLHSMWTLEGLEALPDSLIIAALNDPVAGIRENAIRLAELHLRENPQLGAAVMSLRNDADAKVRFQLLLTLGFVNNAEAAKVRNKLLFGDINDKWVQVAALSASGSQSRTLLSEVLTRYDPKIAAYGSLVERLTAMIGRNGKSGVINEVLASGLGSSSSKNASILTGLATGIQSRDSAANISAQLERQLVSRFFDDRTAQMRLSALAILKANGIKDSALLSSASRKAAAIMLDSGKHYESRSEAISFLTLGNPAPYQSELQRMIDPKEELKVQLAALNTMSRIPGTRMSAYLIKHWQTLTPEIRSASIPTFMGDSNRIALLIDALEKGKIQPTAVSFGTSVQLMQNDNEQLRSRARNIFTRTEREREKVNEQYKEALHMEGDAARGKNVYAKNCGICHQVRGRMGVSFGPDLGTVHNWTKEDVLANVLDPNMSIASGFDTWSITLKSGEKVQGIISSETPVALTLRNNGEVDKTISRQEIESIQSTNTSAMPVGLEKNITKQEMADLLAFLRRNQDFK
jgi:putative membrane-bound dehydrogenase-like protein